MSLSIRIFVFWIVIIIFSSCQKKEKYPGFTETETGLFYKLQAIGAGDRKPKQGDYLELQIVYKTEKDSVLPDLSFHKNRMGMTTIPFQKSSFKGSFEECLAEMNAGDSITCLVNTDSLFSKLLKMPTPSYLQKEKLLKLEVKLCSVKDKEKYRLENQRHQKMMADADIEEQRALKEYLGKYYPGISPLRNGLYYIPIEDGKGNTIKAGETILLNYKGYFLNGDLFDATDEYYPFEYTVGEEEQLIDGIECGIYLMKNKGKAKFIIPSQLAFGSEGSSTGKIPPYTTVIYEIEIVKVY